MLDCRNLTHKPPFVCLRCGLPWAPTRLEHVVESGAELGVEVETQAVVLPVCGCFLGSAGQGSSDDEGPEVSVGHGVSGEMVGCWFALNLGEGKLGFNGEKQNNFS